MALSSIAVLGGVVVEDAAGLGEIGDALGIKRTNFVALINSLEQRGLTERQQVAGDRRANALFLTKVGTAFIARAHAVQAEFEAEMVKRLGGAAARDQLIALLDRLVAQD